MRDEELELLFNNVKTDVNKEEEFNFNFDHLINQQEIISKVVAYINKNNSAFEKAKQELISANRSAHSTQEGKKGEVPGMIGGILGGLYLTYKNVGNIHWGLKVLAYGGGGGFGGFVGNFLGFAAVKGIVWSKDWLMSYQGDVSSVVDMHIKQLEFIVEDAIKTQVRNKLNEIRLNQEREEATRIADAQMEEIRRNFENLQTFNELNIQTALTMEDEVYIDEQLEHVTDPVNYNIITDPVSVEGRNFDRTTLQSIWNMHGLQAATPFTRATLSNPANMQSHMPTRDNIRNLDNMQPTTFREKVLKSRYEHSKQIGQNPYFG